MNLIFPVAGGAGRISQRFGENDVDYSRFGLVGHNGIDFAGELNEPVYSVADGKVVRTGYEANGFGNFIVVDIGTFEAFYAHLAARPKFLPGQPVRMGEVIGRMGQTGYSFGVHLHFGLRPKNANRANGYGGFIDPLPLLSTTAESDVHESGESVDETGENVSDYVEIVCEYGANVRKTPGGEKALDLPAGTVLKTSGRSAEKNGLTHTQVLVPLWIADSDAFGTTILANVPAEDMDEKDHTEETI